MKILVLGAYGNFGARVARQLAGHPHIELLVGGRDAQRCRALAQNLGAAVVAHAIDHTAPDFSDRLRRLGVQLVVHTAGPFQAQGYHVASAALQAGAHYIDLADGRRFVCDFAPALDAAARASQRCAITGASTVPALSAAVVDHLTSGWQHIDSIDICIAPAQTAPRGKATLQAVLAYCGERIDVWQDGRWRTRIGWADLERVHFQRLKPRWGGICDIPDLELFPAHYRVRGHVLFRAALEVPFTQGALAVAARLRARRLLPPLAAWAGVLQRSAPWFDRWGSAQGGMVVRVTGQDAAGTARRRAWHISADQDHGPEIPCMAAILLARRIVRGDTPAAGAMSSLGLLRLDEFEPEFARWGMQTDVLVEPTGDGAAAP